MECTYDVKDYEAIILLMVDLDSLKIIYPITTDEAVIITSLEESPITLSEYLNKLKEYSDKYILYLYDRDIDNSPEGRAYKATDGLLLESDLNTVKSILEGILSDVESLLGFNYQEYETRINSLILSINNRLDVIENKLNNFSYEYEILLFKITSENITPDYNNIVNGNGEFSNGWDITYSKEAAIGKYVWMASTIVKVNNGVKNYGDWSITLLLTNSGEYVGTSDTILMKIYYATNLYYTTLPRPGDNWETNGWTRFPTGVSPNLKYEYVSTRLYNVDGTPVESSWSNPVIYSRWGVDGEDCIGVEYIYCSLPYSSWNPNNDFDVNDNPLNWTNLEGFLENNYIYNYSSSSLWQSTPVNLNKANPYLYISIRKKKYNKGTDSYYWNSFTRPVLWSSLGKDGSNGNSSGENSGTPLVSNEVVILDKEASSPNSHFVAGMTGGDSKIIINNSDSENNPVRIWAGLLEDVSLDEEGNYLPIEVNLEAAPFKVRQNGELVSEKAKVKVESLSFVNKKSFWYNESEIDLPDFNQDEHKLIHILLNNSGDCIIRTPLENYGICNLENNGWGGSVSSVTLSDNTLYTLISNYNNDKYNWYVLSTTPIQGNNGQTTGEQEVEMYFRGSYTPSPVNAKQLTFISHIRDSLSPHWGGNSNYGTTHSGLTGILEGYAGKSLYIDTHDVYLKDSDYFYLILPKYCTARIYRYLGDSSTWNTDNQAEVNEFMLTHKNAFYESITEFIDDFLYTRLDGLRSNGCSQSSSEVESLFSLFWGEFEKYYFYITKRNEIGTREYQYVYNNLEDNCTYIDNLECFYTISGEFIDVDLNNLEESDYRIPYPNDPTGHYNASYAQLLYYYKGVENIPTTLSDTDPMLRLLRKFYKEVSGADVKIYRVRINENEYGNHYSMPELITLSSRELEINISCKIRDQYAVHWKAYSPFNLNHISLVECISPVAPGVAVKFLIENPEFLRKIIRYINPDIENDALEYVVNEYNTAHFGSLDPGLRLNDVKEWLLDEKNHPVFCYKLGINPQWKYGVHTYVDMDNNTLQDFKTAFKKAALCFVWNVLAHPNTNVTMASNYPSYQVNCGFPIDTHHEFIIYSGLTYLAGFLCGNSVMHFDDGLNTCTYLGDVNKINYLSDSQDWQAPICPNLKKPIKDESLEVPALKARIVT